MPFFHAFTGCAILCILSQRKEVSLAEVERLNRSIRHYFHQTKPTRMEEDDMQADMSSEGIILKLKELLNVNNGFQL